MIEFGVPEAALLIAETILKICLILAAAGWIAGTLRRKAPSAAHMTWVLAFVAIIVLPFVTLFIPWRDVIFLNLRPHVEGRQHTTPVHAAPISLASTASVAYQEVTKPENIAAWNDGEQSMKIFRSSLLLCLFFAWLIGFLAVVIRCVHGLYSLSVIRKYGTIALCDEWMLDEVERLSRFAGRRRPFLVRLSATAELPMPMTWGTLLPTVVLPLESRSWSRNRFEATLLHELAHIRRLDFFTQSLAEFACALYWFNPAVWFSARTLRSDAELAADEAVLCAGLKASDYASELLKLAADLGNRPIPFATLGTPAMTNSKIETRLEAILQPSAGKRGVTTLQALAALAISTLAVSGFASLHMSTKAAQDGDVNERTVALSNIKQTTLATIMYANDYDDIYPYVQQTASAVSVLQPYAKTDKIFYSPTKGGKFMFNMNIAGVLTSSIPDPASTPMWIEWLPDPKQKVAVGFADGHTRLVSPTDFAAIKKAAAAKFPRPKTSKPLPANYKFKWPVGGTTPASHG